MIKYLIAAAVIGGGGYAAWKSGIFSKKKKPEPRKMSDIIKNLPKPADVVKQTRQSATPAAAPMLLTPEGAPEQAARLNMHLTTPAPSTRGSGIPRTTRQAPAGPGSALMSNAAYNVYRAKYDY